MKILLLFIQKLLDVYYIFGYYISGWDHQTENVITENEIKTNTLCMFFLLHYHFPMEDSSESFENEILSQKRV